MMAPSTAGLSRCQSSPSALVTLTKSAPRNTPVTPVDLEQRAASGDSHSAAAQ